MFMGRGVVKGVIYRRAPQAQARNRATPDAAARFNRGLQQNPINPGATALMLCRSLSASGNGFPPVPAMLLSAREADRLQRSVCEPAEGQKARLGP